MYIYNANSVCAFIFMTGILGLISYTAEAWNLALHV